MKITLNNNDIHKILVDKFGEQDFELQFYENHKLLLDMWNRNVTDMRTPPIMKSRFASFDGFKLFISVVDKRIDPARYNGSTDISQDEKQINDEIVAEGRNNKYK